MVNRCHYRKFLNCRSGEQGRKAKGDEVETERTSVTLGDPCIVNRAGKTGYEGAEGGRHKKQEDGSAVLAKAANETHNDNGGYQGKRESFKGQRACCRIVSLEK